MSVSRLISNFYYHSSVFAPCGCVAVAHCRASAEFELLNRCLANITHTAVVWSGRCVAQVELNQAQGPH